MINHEGLIRTSLFDWHIGGALGGFPFGLRPKFIVDQKKEKSSSSNISKKQSKRAPKVEKEDLHIPHSLLYSSVKNGSVKNSNVKKAIWMAYTGFGFDLPKKMFIQINALIGGAFLEKLQTSKKFSIPFYGGGEGIFGIKPGVGFYVGLATGIEYGKFDALEDLEFQNEKKDTTYNYRPKEIAGYTMFLGPYVAWQFKKYYRIALRAQKIFSLSLRESDYQNYTISRSLNHITYDTHLKHFVSLKGWRLLASFEFMIPFKKGEK